MSRARLTEVRLTAFKSFHEQVLPLDEITVLTGLNSAGKSNALDGLEVLARLAVGDTLTETLDSGSRDSNPIRGGSAGCAPHGSTRFTLGCTVRSGTADFEFDVTVEVEPELRIVDEALRGPAPGLKTGQLRGRDLIRTQPVDTDDTGIRAAIFNGRRDTDPVSSFRDNRLVTAQIPGRLRIENETDAAVLTAAESVTDALRGIFHLDPIPHLMRDYVPRRDADLRRTADNLSAALDRLSVNDRRRLNRIARAVADVGGSDIKTIRLIRSSLGDVMLAIREEHGGRTETTPAREMSDGLLRFMAIATALFTATGGLDIQPGPVDDDDPSRVLLVIEELENGLHPSQAGKVLRLVEECTADSSNGVLFTTHSPALLNELTGTLNTSVIVCYRDEETGHSRLSRSTDLPGYAEALAIGAIGDAVSAGRLVRPAPRQVDVEATKRLFGIG